ncbi:interleukin 21 receptor, tandem duplicate 1 [Lampris incognitus]|uniref:interleukin 21 receptor, tandem duplicate 1 n=1 Tax=Lampris incognitus TaxID=2546036 RepID=UPI0024B599F3|nr:interleukin 21 receptor, tandem duplicate 1 [Lampris incognitus]
MAVKFVTLLLLDLTFLSHYVAAFCNVTCTTDYATSLNCSCPGSLPLFPVLLEAKLRDFEEETYGSCEIKPPQSWCLMYPDRFNEFASIGTNCTARVKHWGGQVRTNVNESYSWALSDMVTLLKPTNVKVTNNSEFMNITWDMDNNLDECLRYRVRLTVHKDIPRPPNDCCDRLRHPHDPDSRISGLANGWIIQPLFNQDPDYCFLVDQTNLQISLIKLQPNTKYFVDVQASFCPEAMYKGPWSEWSAATECRTMKHDGAVWWSLALLLLLPYSMYLFIHRFLKPCWLKITYIPKPDGFFKPLYSTYGGNFKDWVRPGFSEYDVLRIGRPIEVTAERNLEVLLHWNTEKESHRQDNEEDREQRTLSHDSFHPHSVSLFDFQDGGSWQGHSTGHISIHMVTLSGEEESEERPALESFMNILRRCQDEGTSGPYAEGPGDAGYDLASLGAPPRISRDDELSGRELQDGFLAQEGNQISVSNIDCQPHYGHALELERVSLDSFASNEQLEDGYPCVDLDTIDSGFGESDASSPVTSGAPNDSILVNQEENSSSHYVKQWIIYGPLWQDSDNSVNPPTL